MLRKLKVLNFHQLSPFLAREKSFLELYKTRMSWLFLIPCGSIWIVKLIYQVLQNTAVRIWYGIVLNQTKLGSISFLKILSLLFYVHGSFFWFRPLIFLKTCFTYMYKSYTSFVKFFSKYFILFDVIISWILNFIFRFFIANVLKYNWFLHILHIELTSYNPVELFYWFE